MSNCESASSPSMQSSGLLSHSLPQLLCPLLACSLAGSLTGWLTHSLTHPFIVKLITGLVLAPGPMLVHVPTTWVMVAQPSPAVVGLHAKSKAARRHCWVSFQFRLSRPQVPLQVQQLGRTHRSNQLQPPKYLIVSTDISGEHRFASAVACRLQQLGALTHGDRHAASAADALSSSNLQNK